MMRLLATRPSPTGLIAAVVAAAGLALVYGGQIDTGLFFDDFHQVRPWSAIEVRRVLYGSWDPTGIERAYFRPAAAWLYAARFELFGLNTAAMHGVSIAVHGLCALLLAWFLLREGASRAIGCFGAWLYAIHPAFPVAQVGWLTNQFHLAQSVVVLSALLVWQAVRDKSPVWWTPLGVLAALAFLIKEDGIMLLPVIGALTALRAWIGGGRLPKGWPWLAAWGVAAGAALVALRSDRLGDLGGFGEPGLHQAYSNLMRGIQHVQLAWPSGRVPRAGAAGLAMLLIGTALAVGFRPWRERRFLILAGACITSALALEIPPALAALSGPVSPFAWPPVVGGIVVAALTVGSGAALLREDRQALWLIAAGAAILLTFNIPFLIISKHQQYHLLGLGAVVTLTGCAQAIARSATPRRAQLLVVGVLAAASLPFAVLGRQLAAEFAPCTGHFGGQGDPRWWWVVPDGIGAWMDAKAEGCRIGRRPPPLVEIPLVIWGVHGQGRDPSGEVVRWTSDRAVVLVPDSTSAVVVAVRRPDAAPDRPVRVAIRHSGRTRQIVLDSNEWRYTTFSLTPSLVTLIRRSHRVNVEVLDWFVPAVRDPRNQDVRRYGVELRVLPPPASPP